MNTNRILDGGKGRYRVVDNELIRAKETLNNTQVELAGTKAELSETKTMLATTKNAFDAVIDGSGDWSQYALLGNSISDGNGYVLVPSKHLTAYRNAFSLADDRQFQAIEDYTVDGTVYGELDESKI